MTATNHFNQKEILRYTRHFAVKNIGLQGQRKLKDTSVLIVGAGGIGSPASLYLASCGIGKLGIVDHDRIEMSNLQRQILYQTKQVGELKADCAETALKHLNDDIEINAYHEHLNAKNIDRILNNYSIIIDGSDNYPTRYLVNDYCKEHQKLLITASIYNFEGQIAVLCGDNLPCYRCLYPAAPESDVIPNCAQAGVLGVIPGVVGTITALEVIKQILEITPNLQGKLMTFNGMDYSMQVLEINQTCRCTSQPKIVIQKETATMKIPLISPQALDDQRKQGHELTLIDVREPFEREICVISNDLHVPLNEISTCPLIDKLPLDANIVVYCRSGHRSDAAGKILKEKGFTKVKNLDGGILAWASAIDLKILKY